MAWLMDTETGYASCQICTAITRTTLNSVLGYWAILKKLIVLFDLFTFLLNQTHSQVRRQFLHSKARGTKGK